MHVCGTVVELEVDFVFHMHTQALHYRKYSSASDVWSFGILLYEVLSLGLTPYKQKSQEEVCCLKQ